MSPPYHVGMTIADVSDSSSFFLVTSQDRQLGHLEGVSLRFALKSSVHWSGTTFGRSEGE